MVPNERVRLFIVSEGSYGATKPIFACDRSPRFGVRVFVYVDRATREQGRMFVMFRKGHGDLVVGAAASDSALAPVRARLGDSVDQYDVAEVPILVEPPDHAEQWKLRRRRRD
ncbi:MAG: hypothetical protein JST92_10240 [Deltaproteobacteria bacterium]|nr:hypothetical protein [Deltaproteobacteria bacterium]